MEIHPSDKELFSLDQPVRLIHSIPKENKIRSYGSASVTLQANTVEYYCEVFVGTPGQTFEVQVDTGSSLFAIPLVTCDSCSHYNRLFEPFNSTTSRILSCDASDCTHHKCYSNFKEISNPTCLFNISYGDNSNIVGPLIRDLVAFPAAINTGNGSQTVNLTGIATFGGIADESPAGGFQSPQVDGILGMAYGSTRMSCVPNCVKPVFDELVSQLHLDDIFALSLEPIDSGVGKGGVLTLGGAIEDPGMVYTPVKEQSYYVVAMETIIIGETMQILPEETHYPLTVVDSGTTFMVVSSTTYNAVKKVFQTQFCNLPFVCSAPSLFDGKCVNKLLLNDTVLATFPNITLVIEDMYLIIPPTLYLEKTKTSKGEFYCFGIMDGGKHSVTILGDTVLRGYYVVFDRKNSRIGFLPTLGFAKSRQETSMKLPITIYGGILLATIVVGFIITLSMVLYWKLSQSRYAGYQTVALNE